MTKRDNHYEVAFEGWLQHQRVPYVAVDEQKRSQLGDRSLKSLDFIVSPPDSPYSWLVDVKGRRFPGGVRQKQYWKNWATDDDLASLSRWQELFGGRFAAILLFAYEVVGELAPLPMERMFAFRGRLYGFVGIRLDHYSSWARPISAKWNTVAIPAKRFRELARPADEIFLPENQSAAKGSPAAAV